MGPRLELPYESLYKIHKIVQNPFFKEKKIVYGEKSEKGAYNLEENHSIIIRRMNDRSYVLSDLDVKISISRIQSEMLA